MKILPNFAFSFAACVTTILWTTASVELQARPAITDNHLSLAVKAEKKEPVSGSMVPVRAIFRNKNKLPFCFVQSYPARYTFLFRATFGVTNLRVPLTEFGRIWKKPHPFLPSHWLPPTQVVAPGELSEYRTDPQAGQYVFVARFLDMTMPGEYHVRLITKYGVQKCGPGLVHTVHGLIRIKNHLFLIQDGFFRGHIAIGSQNILSNRLNVTIAAPYRRLPALALMEAIKTGPKLPQNMPAGIHVILTEPDAYGPQPISIRAKFIVSGMHPVTRRLTGNPFADFGKIEVTGPSDLDQVPVVKTPKPHDIHSRMVVPARTLYGHWLAKHAPRNLKWRAYTLKPGVIYQYAVPINLSCQYDMSRSGTYRVRVELAHPNIWSNWIKVKVPY
jgi:hypothetical protein